MKGRCEGTSQLPIILCDFRDRSQQHRILRANEPAIPPRTDTRVGSPHYCIGAITPIFTIAIGAMLHITNGESVIHSFRASSITGSYLSWMDVLHDGPVPYTSTLEALSDLRAQALQKFRWGSYDEIRSAFAARDRALLDFQRHDEVVLWFEHDLFDQLQLIQILDWFSG